jgi:hypothetical protein
MQRQSFRPRESSTFPDAGSMSDVLGAVTLLEEAKAR